MLSNFKRWVQSTIGVSSREANAFLIFFPAIFLIIFSQPLFQWVFQQDQPLAMSETTLLDSVLNQVKLPVARKPDSIILFRFNPNVASVDELKSLGITDAVARRINQYRLKGGKFKVKKDMAKMYGMDSTVFITLVPFIDLPDEIPKKESMVSRPLMRNEIQLDLNRADTADFKSVQGIGTVLAKRILKYRTELGGFVQPAQLNEVYGLDSTVIQHLQKFYVADGFLPVKMNINQLSEKDLDKHPYLSPKEAKAVITYRLQHGFFKTVDDLRKVKLMRETTIQKLIPYLSFE